MRAAVGRSVFVLNEMKKNRCHRKKGFISAVALLPRSLSCLVDRCDRSQTPQTPQTLQP
eukprot:COSAG06_NODE_7216_length_2582_cov_0.847021_1_plen_58_part_10